MPSSIVRGNTITLDGLFEESDGTPVDPPDARVSILDPNGATVVSLDTPMNIGVGQFQYEYPVALTALLGAWAIRWRGTVSGSLLTVDEGFTVLAASESAPPSAGGQTCSPWATHTDPFCAATLTAGVDPDELDLCLQIATDVLWNLTRRTWSGRCTDSIRPQAEWKKWDGPPQWWPSTIAQGLSTSPWGFCSCHRGRETGCSRIPELELPNGPVDPDSITVMLNGEPFIDFRLDDSRYLIRTDGSQWPCCQDLLLADDQPNTFSIAYAWEKMPPVGGVRACAQYGCQLALGFNPETASKCLLPARVTRVTRQGVTSSFTDPTTLVEKGQTGLVAVDQWVASVLAGVNRRRATVMIPGRHRGSRRVNH